MNLLKDITIGQYVPGRSPIHQLDPRVKIALVFLFMIHLFMNQFWFGFVIYGLVLIGVTLLSKLPFFYVIRGLKPVLILVTLTVFFNLFFSRGTIIWQQRIEIIESVSFSLQITREGLTTGLTLAAKLLLLVFSTSLLTLTTSPLQLNNAIENMMTPLKIIKIPAHELAMMVTIAFRFIPVLIDETDKIMKAQRSRGAAFGEGNILQKAKSLLPVLVPLFVHAFKHAEDLALAMESRCYRGGEGRTSLKSFRVTYRDFAAILIFGSFIAGIAWLDLYTRV